MAATTVTQALEEFIARQQALQPGLPLTPYDPDWASPCYQSSGPAGTPVPWRPVKQTPAQDMFERLGAALETAIHPDLAAFYSLYWSDPLPARSRDGELNLLQAWNPDDLERLRSNLIGHALAKRKQRQPLTLFFACTEPDGDYFLSIDNQSGKVLLEAPGKAPLRVLADSLAEFIASLEPLPIKDME